MKQDLFAINRLTFQKYYFLFALLIVLLITGCRKKPGDLPPSINFITGNNYISKDTLLKAGSRFLFGVIADKGDNDLTNFQVRRKYSGGEEVIMDTGIHNQQLIYSNYLSKGVYSSEIYYFRILDKQGDWSEISFTVNAVPNAVFDSIRYIPSVVFGAQQCTAKGSFYDLKNNLIYFQDQAFLVQDSIDMLYYYASTGEANTVASPGAYIDSIIFPGPTGILQWTVRNETRYFKTTISTAAFDAVINDSLLIASFDQLHSHRKAKNLAAGDVYSFRTVNGKFGLFKTVNVTGAETGTVELSIKVQK